MLVLSRKPGEAICIGSNIKVSVLDIKGSRVRLGFSAPPGVPIHRSENLLRINGSLTERPADDPSGDTERPKAVDGDPEGAACRRTKSKRRVRRSLSAED